MTTPTPSSVWVVCDKEGDCLFASEHKSIADDHFQHCVDEESDFRAGPYTLTEYVPKRDLAARDAELADMKTECSIHALATRAQRERAEAAEDRDTVSRDALDYLYGLTPERVAQLRAAERELASVKAENSKLRSALSIVHFKQEPWQ